MGDCDDNLVFVPPKKRSSGTSSLKRLSGGGTLNRVDHIVFVQGQDGAPVPLEVASNYSTMRTPRHTSDAQNSNTDLLSITPYGESSKLEENGNLSLKFKSSSSLDDDIYFCNGLVVEDDGMSCHSYSNINRVNKPENPSIASLASFNIDSCGNVSCNLSNVSNEGTMDHTPISVTHSRASSPSESHVQSLEDGTHNDLDSSNEMLCEEGRDLALIRSEEETANEICTGKVVQSTSNVNASDASLGSCSMGSIAMTTTSQEGGLSEPNSDTCLLKRSKRAPKGHEGSVQFVDPDGISDDECINEMTALHDDVPSTTVVSDNQHHTKVSIRDEGTYLTMTGTIQRGKKAGQNIDVKLNMSREELETFEKSFNDYNSHQKLSLGCRNGPHIFIWSLFCSPFIFIVSLFYAFYMGTLTWYNIFMHFNEERTIWHKIIVSPLLILFFPFLITIPTFCLSVYSACVQLSWSYLTWNKEVTDLEKGFFGWLCTALKVEDCSPYEIVVLTEVQDVTQDFKLDKSSNPEAQCQYGC